jgi:hypothetical protein
MLNLQKLEHKRQFREGPASTGVAEKSVPGPSKMVKPGMEVLMLPGPVEERAWFLLKW